MKTKPVLTSEDCDRQKSRSAAVSRRSTKVSVERIAAGRIALLRMPPLPVQGGVPIMVQAECVRRGGRVGRAVARGRAGVQRRHRGAAMKPAED